MKWLLTISIVFIWATGAAQPFVLEAGGSITVEPGASIFISNEALFQGSLHNEGLLVLNHHADFGTNAAGGSLQFAGPGNHTLKADSFKTADFSLRKQNGTLLLQAGDLEITGSLRLLEGNLLTGPAGARLSGLLEGGTAASYVEGTLSRMSKGGELFFPMGLGGHFNSLLLPSTISGDEISVTIGLPDRSKLIPGDSLVGLSDKVEWIISHKDAAPMSSTIEVDFSGVDMNSLVNAKTIRAYQYELVLAYTDSLGIYHQMGTSSLTDTDFSTYGLLASKKRLLINDRTQHICIGKMPVSTGPMFYIPNIFSPNAAQEENRLFRPYLGGHEISRVDFSIWDAFNNIVFHIDMDNADMDKVGWNGLLSNGAHASEGVYYYSVSLKTIGGVFDKKGSFVLLQ